MKISKAITLAILTLATQSNTIAQEGETKQNGIFTSKLKQTNFHNIAIIDYIKITAKSIASPSDLSEVAIFNTFDSQELMETGNLKNALPQIELGNVGFAVPVSHGFTVTSWAGLCNLKKSCDGTRLTFKDLETVLSDNEVKLVSEHSSLSKTKPTNQIVSWNWTSPSEIK